MSNASPQKIGNNMDRARAVFVAHHHSGRDVCINKMVEAGIKPTTSNTYYVTLLKNEITSVPNVPVVATQVEDESVVKARITERFDAMELMVESTILGLNRALIISGPPGLGKSYGVMKKAKENEMLGRNIVQIQGNVGATGLYRSLYENRGDRDTIVFDDADAIFSDEISLNILKAACDSTKSRYINWLKEIKMEDDSGTKLPRRFEFDGSIIFITNKDFDAMIARDNKLVPHLSALMSRAMYLDLMLKTPRDYLIRIKQVLFDLKMYEQQNLTLTEAEDIMKFVEANVDKFRECDLSLRLVIKISNWFKTDPCNWKRLSEMTFFRH